MVAATCLAALSPRAGGAVAFPGEFAPGANWSAATNLGSVVMTANQITITGPGGAATGSVRSSVDQMNYVGSGGAGVSESTWVYFHWQLNPGNSLGAAAYFTLGGTNYLLSSSAYGGANTEGYYSAVLPQGINFGFTLDSQIYKGTAPQFIITEFCIVPEASAWWMGLPLALAGVWRLRRGGKVRQLKANPNPGVTT